MIFLIPSKVEMRVDESLPASFALV
jgi:hypothetical protein